MRPIALDADALGREPDRTTGYKLFQEVAGLGATITGSIGFPSDVDMYAITMAVSGTFAATTAGQPGTLSDTQLFLFTFPGLGVIGNDDASSTSKRSTLPAVPLAAGLYFLAISSFDVDPVSPTGLIFPTAPFTGVFVDPGRLDPLGCFFFGCQAIPYGLGPGGGSVISGWLDSGKGTGATGTYSILLGVAPYGDVTNPGGPDLVPEPATLLLFGTAMAGLGVGARWKRRKQN